ncbi:MAG TPA: sirohydrochlorin chelatase [Pirellulales bacterium]
MPLTGESNRQPLPPDGLIIVGHGTRDERGCAEFAELVQQVILRAPRTIVEGCFLELVEPDLPRAVDRAIERGASCLAVVPLLLVSAGHANRDIPQLVAAAADKHPTVGIEQMPHLGSHSAVRELAQRRYAAAIEGLRTVAANETLHLVVGRGTKDPAANIALCGFARQRQEQTGAGWLETCFLAMTEPSLERGLQLLPGLPFRRVVVEPHLLFQGELLDRVRSMVASATAQWLEREFVVVDRLGPDPALARAILELAEIPTSEAS